MANEPAEALTSAPEFRVHRQKVVDTISACMAQLQVYKAINADLDTVERYKWMFYPIRLGLATGIVIETGKLFADGRDEISLNKMVADAIRNPDELAPRATPGQLQQIARRLRAHRKGILRPLEDLRNHYVGHLLNNDQGPPPDLDIEGMEELLNTAAGVLSELSLLHNGEGYWFVNFEREPARETERVMSQLRAG